MSSKKRNKKKRVKRKLKKLGCLFIFLLLLGIGIFLYFNHNVSMDIIIKDTYKYLASDTNLVELYELDSDNNVLVKNKDLFRGIKVKVKDNDINYENNKYRLVIIDNKEYYVDVKNLVDKEDEVVLESNIYTRTSTSIISDLESSKISGLANKGDFLEVIGYDSIDEEGNVHFYKIKDNNVEGYIYGKYTSFTKEEALKNYKSEEYDAIHSKVKDYYGGGSAIKLDFYPYEKPVFDDNKMPDSVYALYLNSGVINNIDAYINFARDTKINSFVVDIKDNESPAFPANTFKNLSPTNYEKAINSYDDYKSAIKKLKDNGFYVIGRITTFKDTYYVQDHKENAIMNKNTNSPYLHNGSYWPSAYNRDVWFYTLSLAKEAVKEFGFNEINFDYVRFPDRMNSVSNYIELGNIYNEDKVEAIQRFVRYVTDSLHELHAYVSIDVFGESVNSTYTTAYGQYWPAISNIADAISGMPYPDHFAAGSYGLAKPWNNPYLLMKYWGSYANDRQKEIPTPAKARTWVQAYDVMNYVDANGINYNAYEVEQEIRGLYDSGLKGGYITWLSNSNLNKYNLQKKAFQIDYLKEYNN